MPIQFIKPTKELKELIFHESIPQIIPDDEINTKDDYRIDYLHSTHTLTPLQLNQELTLLNPTGIRGFILKGKTPVATFDLAMDESGRPEFSHITVGHTVPDILNLIEKISNHKEIKNGKYSIEFIKIPVAGYTVIKLKGESKELYADYLPMQQKQKLGFLKESTILRRVQRIGKDLAAHTKNFA